MVKNEIADSDRPGRRSGIKRLNYRLRSDKGDAGKASSGSRMLDWSSYQEHLRRTVRRAPEVVIIVDGGGRSDERGQRSEARDLQGVRKYLLYISRNGKLPISNELGEQLRDRDDILGNLDSWNLQLQQQTGWTTHRKTGRGGKVEQLHQTFNMIFSMPTGTNPDMLLDAVKAFASQHFRERQFVMVLHTPETDPAPKSKRAEHPHVHVIVRAEDDNGRRLHIRKGDLLTWRADFAHQLRERGIEANATSRSERGVSLKSTRGAEFHIKRRWRDGKGPAPTALAQRFHQAAQELQEGRTEMKPWEIAMAVRRRDEQRKLKESAERLRKEGKHELADEVEHFIQTMPPVQTERRNIQKALLEQVERRRHEHKDMDAQRDIE